MRWWRRRLVGVMACALPAGATTPGIDPDRCAELIERLRCEAPLLIRFSLHASVAVFLLSPLVTVGRPCPASWLSAENLDRHTARMARHPSYLLRQAMLMIKTVAGLCWGADPAVRRALGMEPYPAETGEWRRM
ncbi:MAG: hypothetical protein QGI46_11585 [Planctomycetota bacterium]|jgi:hypothetical protein|nr:hypothetical protein [Planctomycetota bacterium]